MKWVIAFWIVLWTVEIGVIASAVAATMTDHNPWPLIVLAIGFGLACPYPHNAVKGEGA